ncbi:uncharacterized protein K441DRAFT_16176 [Cenococcum geophilum 1.58]|uniref:uncharacterized protein n=1 Tax=Cenococcum geophilum 1.58 TaxID=794803 RepID=UPI00358DE9F0|nr:hypothetical protein K441DRAFT_16176 [Cenococcum geophilum 1.58]
MFGADSSIAKSGQWKERSSSSSRCINPVGDRSLLLNKQCKQLIHDDHGVQDPNRDRTATPSPSEAVDDGLYAGRSANMERDGGELYSRMEGLQRRETNGSSPTPLSPPYLPSRKRSAPPARSRAPPPKRSRESSRVAARRAMEAEGMSAHSDSPREETLRHAFPRHYRDKAWDIVHLGAVYLEQDGSLS